MWDLLYFRMAVAVGVLVAASVLGLVHVAHSPVVPSCYWLYGSVYTANPKPPNLTDPVHFIYI